MKDENLLNELLAAETEGQVLAALEARSLLKTPDRWEYLGGMPNNQSIVQTQQSSATAALIEKYSNACDALLIKRCKELGQDPRGPGAPRSMADAVEQFYGDLHTLSDDDRRVFAEKNLLLYAEGSKLRPTLSIYDNGEGQHPDRFPDTFCSLIYGAKDQASYKGAIPFVQGRFNMGGTGVLPFCSEKRKLQLVVSRVPDSIKDGKPHEWGYTLFCYFPSETNPSWMYLVGPDKKILTAGSDPLALVPKLRAQSGELSSPRERKVESGTLIKLIEYQAVRSNICGEQFKKLEDFLLRPALPMRMIECRKAYLAKVMGSPYGTALNAGAPTGWNQTLRRERVF